MRHIKFCFLTAKYVKSGEKKLICRIKVDKFRGTGNCMFGSGCKFFLT